MKIKSLLQKNRRNSLTVLAFVVVVAAGYFLSPVLSPETKSLSQNDDTVLISAEKALPEDAEADVVQDKDGKELLTPGLREKIGQMLVIGFRGTDLSQASFISGALDDLKPGGVILFDFDVPSQSFPRNIVNSEQVKKLIADLQSGSSVPLFVAVDAEGGAVNRLKSKYGFIDVPSAQQMGKESADNTRLQGETLGKELAYLGFNLDFAPVVDVNVNPQNPVIGKIGRSFSIEPQAVIEHAAAFIKGLEKYQIITSIKHFPGHGSSASDSHKGITDITESYKAPELWPFQELIKSGLAETVMVGHLVNKNIDSEFPATLSKIFINKILKQDLGFDGVVVCDDLQMGAITQNYGLEEAAVRMVAAGCDLLIISNNVGVYDETAPYKARDAILRAVESGGISKDSIEASFIKIENLKKKFGIIE
ncbi:MAG: glycoside hydrolase family 3 protein [Candidatus Pacebacteria bacterium]|nr:glycoside hydrolase family 3 protein [Candidatus Paceibacterota bacterium]